MSLEEKVEIYKANVQIETQRQKPANIIDLNKELEMNDETKLEKPMTQKQKLIGMLSTIQEEKSSDESDLKNYTGAYENENKTKQFFNDLSKSEFSRQRAIGGDVSDPDKNEEEDSSDDRPEIEEERSPRQNEYMNIINRSKV